MKNTILALLTIITTPACTISQNFSELPEHSHQVEAQNTDEHKGIISVDNCPDECSETDFVSDFEYSATSEDDQESLKQRIINFAKNAGVHVLLFMLDARDYINSYFPSSDDNGNASKR